MRLVNYALALVACGEDAACPCAGGLLAEREAACSRQLTTAEAAAGAKAAGLEKSLADVRARLAEATAAHTNEVAALQTQLEAGKSERSRMAQEFQASKVKFDKELANALSRTSQVGDLQSKLESCTTMNAGFKKAIDGCEAQKLDIEASYDQQLARITAQKTSAEEALRALQADMEKLQNRVFNADHVRMLSGQTLRVGKAFASNIKNNINRAANADVFELGSLQMKLLGRKLQASAQPYVDQLSQVPAVQALVNTHLPQARETAKQHAVQYGSMARTFVEKRMDNMIESLSKSDSSIREAFPEHFEGRLISFLFIFALFYAVLSVVSYVFGLITAPFWWVIGRKTQTGKAKKTAKSGKADSKPVFHKPTDAKVSDSKTAFAKTTKTEAESDSEALQGLKCSHCDGKLFDGDSVYIKPVFHKPTDAKVSDSKTAFAKTTETEAESDSEALQGLKCSHCDGKLFDGGSVYIKTVAGNPKLMSTIRKRVENKTVKAGGK